MSALRRRRFRPPAAPAKPAVGGGPAEPQGNPAPALTPAPAPAAVRVKECPFCLKAIPEIALECPACRRRIAGAGSPADFRRRLLAQELLLRQTIRERRLGGAGRGLLGSLRLRTLAASGVTGVCLGRCWRWPARSWPGWPPQPSPEASWR